MKEVWTFVRETLGRNLVTKTPLDDQVITVLVPFLHRNTLQLEDYLVHFRDYIEPRCLLQEMLFAILRVVSRHLYLSSRSVLFRLLLQICH
jgi:hypothetical protein